MGPLYNFEVTLACALCLDFAWVSAPALYLVASVGLWYVIGAFSVIFEPVHEISNNKVCATSQALDQPAHTRSLIRAFASRLSILNYDC